MAWSSDGVAPTMALGSLTDTIMQFGMLVLLVAVGIAGGVVWLAVRRWGPALRHLSSVVDRELGQAEHSADLLQKSAQAQMKRVYRQAASVRGALDGVKSLGSLTKEIEERARDLQGIAQQMATDSTTFDASIDLAQYTVNSADELAHTAERAAHTYRKLVSSLDQLISETEGQRDLHEESERHVRELTGAVERVRHAVADQRGAARAPRQTMHPSGNGGELIVAARQPTPPRDARADERPHAPRDRESAPPYDESLPRRSNPGRRDVPRRDDAPPRDGRRDEPQRDEPRREPPPARPVTRSRRPEPDAPNRGDERPRNTHYPTRDRGRPREDAPASRSPAQDEHQPQPRERHPDEEARDEPRRRSTPPYPDEHRDWLR